MTDETKATLMRDLFEKSKNLTDMEDRCEEIEYNAECEQNTLEECDVEYITKGQAIDTAEPFGYEKGGN